MSILLLVFDGYLLVGNGRYCFDGVLFSLLMTKRQMIISLMVLEIYPLALVPSGDLHVLVVPYT